jgi:hypothetical protein
LGIRSLYLNRFLYYAMIESCKKLGKADLCYKYYHDFFKFVKKNPEKDMEIIKLGPEIKGIYFF